MQLRQFRPETKKPWGIAVLGCPAGKELLPCEEFHPQILYAYTADLTTSENLTKMGW